MRRLATSDVIGGLGVVAVGAFVIWEASHYPLGELRRMGPGYFPMALGVVLAGLGLFIAAEGLRPHLQDAEEGLPFQPSLRPVLAITAGLTAFAALMESAGLAPATVALVVIASLAERRFRPVTTVATAIILAVAAVLVFIRGFGMPLQAFI